MTKKAVLSLKVLYHSLLLAYISMFPNVWQPWRFTRSPSRAARWCIFQPAFSNLISFESDWLTVFQPGVFSCFLLKNAKKLVFTALFWAKLTKI